MKAYWDNLFPVSLYCIQIKFNIVIKWVFLSWSVCLLNFDHQFIILMTPPSYRLGLRTYETHFVLLYFILTWESANNTYEWDCTSYFLWKCLSISMCRKIIYMSTHAFHFSDIQLRHWKLWIINIFQRKL